MLSRKIAKQNKFAAASIIPEHHLAHLEDDLVLEFHWITVDETKKILAWIAERTCKKSGVRRGIFYRFIRYFLTPSIESIIMANIKEQMTAAVAALQTTLEGAAPTTEQITDQIHSVVDPQIQALKSALEAFEATDATDDEATAASLADLTGAIKVFTDAFAPKAPEEPVPTPDQAA